ncbi:thrombospondin N-terminal-like domain protein [Kalymmatonema gypsitolerans NIES-4073]|nr:thrombospondin N-terminal-like domain protein [Scytonema sp. NIES-4073]
MFNSSTKSKFATLFALSTVLASSITYSPAWAAAQETAQAEAETSIVKSQSCTSVNVLDNIVSFDGQQKFIKVPDKGCLNFGTEDFTISAWIKTTSTSGIEVIVDKRIETSGPVQGYALSNYNGTLLFQLADGGRGGKAKEWYNYESGIPIADGQWHHVAVSVDRDQKDGGHWYLDGVEAGTPFDPTKIPGSLDNTKPLTIGRRSDSSNPGFFRGDIGFVRVFKGVRTFKQ